MNTVYGKSQSNSATYYDGPRKTTDDTSSTVIALCATLLFFASVFLPQGVGLKLAPDLPNLELPRVAMLAMIGLLILRVPQIKASAFSHAPRTLALLATLAIWQFLPAVFSGAQKWSILWAMANVVVFWGFAFSVIVLAGRPEQSRGFVLMLTVLIVLLSLWAALEFITQTKLVMDRNIYFGLDPQRFSPIPRRRVFIDGQEVLMPYMSIGPYGINVIFAGALCSLGGFMLLRKHGSLVLRGLLTGLFVFAVLSAQSRAGVVALAVMLALTFWWTKTTRERVCLVVSSVAAGLMFVLSFGIYEFFLSFSHNVMVPAIDSGVATAGTSVAGTAGYGLQAPGSVEGRWYGLKLLWSQLGDFWLFGYGTGSLFDAERVVTSVKMISDIGSFFCFFAELGLVGGMLLAVLVLSSVAEGVKSADWKVRAATLGLIGFGVTALVTSMPTAWGIALVMAGLIEGWSRVDRANAQVSPA